MGTLGVFKAILLYCVMSCMVCDEAFVGRAPQSIPCLVCAGLVCRICYNRRTGRRRDGLTAPELLIMKRNNECFGYRCDPPCMQVAPLSTTGNVATPPLEQLSNFRPNNLQIFQVSTSHQIFAGVEQPLASQRSVYDESRPASQSGAVCGPSTNMPRHGILDLLRGLYVGPSRPVSSISPVNPVLSNIVIGFLPTPSEWGRGVAAMQIVNEASTPIEDVHGPSELSYTIPSGNEASSLPSSESSRISVIADPSLSGSASDPSSSDSTSDPSSSDSTSDPSSSDSTSDPSSSGSTSDPSSSGSNSDQSTASSSGSFFIRRGGEVKRKFQPWCRPFPYDVFTNLGERMGCRTRSRTQVLINTYPKWLL
ncbi:hypothetical protein DAPPUDRAFT_118378 [Daphnia pulex]|uniref:Uncharacterized protein n=1 Tax=Daphnia pulex TaxID=6669 RepID=E9HVJ4_DAPPU|nr:hypothetical protein DAPPUDRAFT_118378 [Daphnia pulex]|eukprot:EFX64232.1 hypothetical protein DAPPUDRAFT_118378 [Daphnia pulex]